MSYSLTSGKSVSCGCRTGAKERDGLKNTRLYRIWRGIEFRCYHPNNTRYKDYGAKGILMCDEWKESFQAFNTWALNNGYSDGLTIDRIDNSKGYSPENCRWATRKEQQNNTSWNASICFNGEVKNISEWAESIGINRKTISTRKRRGWTDEEILSIPVGVTRKQYYKEKENKNDKKNS